MRLQEFAGADEQINLWKLISDSFWQKINLQALKQKQINAQNQLPKKPLEKFSTKTKTFATPKPTKPPKKQQVTDKSAQPPTQRKSAPQTQKPQVLPKVFSSTTKSNVATPKTPTTSVSSQSPQSLAKTRSERVTHDTNSVANIQRQLYPLAFSDVVKRLTS
jgi:hypothetical protein